MELGIIRMSNEKENKKIIKENYQTLIELGIPVFILDNPRKWLFFLQEGWDGDVNWNYRNEMTEVQQIQFYRFIKSNNIKSCLSNEIELKYNLLNKELFEIKVVESNKKKTSFDFFINQKQLSEQLGINRLDLAYCDFDLDTLEVDKTKFPSYDRKKIIRNAVSCFLGNSKPINQFGTNRIVLYRCHCGCDYCGIISFLLEKKDDLIIWKDITYENDDFNYKEEIENKGIEPIMELKFDRREYELEFENYLKNTMPNNGNRCTTL